MIAVDRATGLVRWHFSSPSAAQVYTAAVVGGRAFVVGEDGAVTALDAATGRAIWSVTTESPIEALPSVAAGIVYVAGNGGPVSALDGATGALRWKVPIQGVPFAPTITSGYVLLGTNVGNLYAIGGPAR
jgi:outer membrane protein assembly factor BamB